MAKILQILDVNSEGHTVRLDNGEVGVIPHGHLDDISVGQLIANVVSSPLGPRETVAITGIDQPIVPSLEFLNGPAQVQGNVLSGMMQQSVDPGDEDQR